MNSPIPVLGEQQIAELSDFRVRDLPPLRFVKLDPVSVLYAFFLDWETFGQPVHKRVERAQIGVRRGRNAQINNGLFDRRVGEDFRFRQLSTDQGAPPMVLRQY